MQLKKNIMQKQNWVIGFKCTVQYLSDKCNLKLYE